MPIADLDGLAINYEVIGDGDQPWTITPGGRFSMETPGVRELARVLADNGKRVVIWDRPNCGGSDVAFTGDSESAVQADALAALLRHLDLPPAVIVGGSGGARVSLLTAARHPDRAAGVAMWWISGGIYGLLTLAMHYCGDSLATAWREGMDAVADLPVWSEVIERRPSNRDRIRSLDRDEFIATMERWMLAYCPQPGQLIPGLPDAVARGLSVPALVFRSGASDVHHTRATSESLAALIPTARLVEPPWGDREWIERGVAGEGLFVRWPLLAPQLLAWAADTLPG